MDKKRHHSFHWKRLFAMFFVVLFVLACFVPSGALAQENKRETVRVGWPIQTELPETNQIGQGYTYDYLMEMAQYTHWNYEFIKVDGTPETQLSTLMEMLETGKIDIVGGVEYQEDWAQRFHFANYHYGTSYLSLYAWEENTELNSSNYFTFPKLTVGVVKDMEKYEEKLQQFSQTNGFLAEKVFYSTTEEMLEALRQGEIDTILAQDACLPAEDLKMITQFAPQPFYFITAQGQYELTNGINFALSSITQANPFFMTTLHTQYFTKESQKLFLSEEEQEYIRQAEPMRVAMLTDRAPFQYKDPQTGELRGVPKDILNDISEMTGLQFEIISVGSNEEYQQLLDQKQVDMAATVPNDYKMASTNTYSLTIPYVEVPITIALHHGVDPNHLEGKRLALLEGAVYQGEY